VETRAEEDDESRGGDDCEVGEGLTPGVLTSCGPKKRVSAGSTAKGAGRTSRV
jgi:hypothetical protein